MPHVELWKSSRWCISSESNLLFCQKFFCLTFQSVEDSKPLLEWLMRLILAKLEVAPFRQRDDKRLGPLLGPK
ncbi:hypothetical protein DPMN_151356 [Dreissena polymorpha]|uniref:Uncharacterized protein n=1 Tax=Dreissena polymorpha TaxID=45954 RepID=A0A9D4FFF7_DREPO|nr:hypothetical protein DPMN_151356 [Dreissena polymorpha]